MGWFGPRGIATIALLLVAAGDEPDLAGLDVVIRVVAATVLLSIVLHGVSAPAARRALRALGAARPRARPSADGQPQGVVACSTAASSPAVRRCVIA